MLVQELYLEPQGGGGPYNGMPMPGNAVEASPPFNHQRPSFSGPGGFEPIVAGGHPMPMDPGGAQLHHPANVPFPTLTNYGVQQETVRQLTEMKAYLWRHVRSVDLLCAALPSCVCGGWY